MSVSTKRPDVEKPDVDDSSDTSDDDDIVHGVKPNGKSFAALMKEGELSDEEGTIPLTDNRNASHGVSSWN